jgi:hypothetical protein
MHDAEKDGQANNGNDALFNCIGGNSGVIHYLQICSNGCKDNGGGNSDSCR